MVDLWRDFCIRENGTGQQVAQLHERYMMMIISNNNYVTNTLYNYYISNKDLLEECDKEDNVSVTGAVITSCLKRRLWKLFSNDMYPPSHRQVGDPMINIQSTLRTAPDWCKKVSLTVSHSLVATVIHIQSVRSQMCARYTHILHNIQTLVG